MGEHLTAKTDHGTPHDKTTVGAHLYLSWLCLCVS